MDEMNYNEYSTSNSEDAVEAQKNPEDKGGPYSDAGENNTANPIYYTECYKKQKTGRNVSFFQFMIAILVSSVLGAGLMLAAVLFVIPSIQPSIHSFLFNNGSEKETVGANENSQTQTLAPAGKYEIITTDSPAEAVAQQVSPSIVGIKTTAPRTDWIFGQGQSQGFGSGIIISSDGYIVTNHHVIEAAMQVRGNKLISGAKIEVILPGSDKVYEATVEGRDSSTDLAVLKINAKGLVPAELGDSDTLKIGQIAVAIGNPGGEQFMSSVTQGVISGLNRQVDENNKEMTYIQTDAPINAGNSGGALVNSKGQVIGVNTLKGSTQLGFEGMGFAIPINKVKEITDSLIQEGYVSRNKPWFGIRVETLFTEEVAKANNLPVGVYVAEVFFLDPAYIAGVKPHDIITEFDGKPVKNVDELNEIKDKHKPGDEVKFKVYRDGEYLTLTVVLGEDKG